MWCCKSFPGSIILIFITEREKYGEQMWDVPVGLGGWSLVAGITFLLSNWMFDEGISNIGNRSWMKRIDNYFILLIVVGDIGEKASEMIRKLWSQKKRTSILTCCRFWWNRQLSCDSVTSDEYLGPIDTLSRTMLILSTLFVSSRHVLTMKRLSDAEKRYFFPLQRLSGWRRWTSSAAPLVTLKINTRP
jgi:hypothetical protein